MAIIRKGDTMDGLQREIAAYDRMRDCLETDHLGEWVVVHDEELAGTYAGFEEAAQEAIRRFGRGPYLIRQVGAGPITLMIPVLATPARADD